MKVYVDIVMITNFILDFILLLGVAIILKRNVNINRIIIGAFIGGLSILFLFIPMNNLMLFIFKFLISIIMVLVTFNYNSFRYTFMNVLYLYILSIFLGGFLYFLNEQFCVKRQGFIFINNKFSITLVFILITSPIVIYLYNKQIKSFKNIYNNYKRVTIYYKDKYIDITGYMDSGNNLTYLNSKVLLLDKRKMIFEVDKYILVPLSTVSGSTIIKCFKPDKVVIENKIIKRVLIGITNSIGLDGVDIILNNRIGE